MTSPAGLQTDWPTEPAGPPPPRRTVSSFMKELPVLVVIAFGVALLMKTFLLQMFYIPSSSMEKTLLGPHDAQGNSCQTCNNGDRVAVNKLAYRFREPRRGEVVVFIKERNEAHKSTFQRVKDFLTAGLGVTTPDETDFIKRIIGLPGETIEVTSKHTFVTTVDGDRLRLVEPYIHREGRNTLLQEPLMIPAGHYFVMGDNRNGSSDSRVFGPIKRTDIIGKAFVKIWPPRRVGLIPAHDFDDAKRVRAGKQRPGKAMPAPDLPAAALALTVAMVAPARARRRARAR